MYGDEAYEPNRDQRLEALMQAGAFEEALDILEAWHAREPWNGEVLMRLAVVHWLAGSPARTLRALDAFLAMEPNHAEALSRRAQALMALGKLEDAEVALRKAEAIDPQTPGVLLNTALLLEARGEYENAVGFLSSYLEKIPGDHLALARRSHLHRQLGAYPQALADALTSVQMHPEDPEAHFAQALAHVTLEQGHAAVTACDQCLERKHDFLPALRLKIDLLADLGRLDEAEQNLQTLLIQDPHSPHTALLHARLTSERGETREALTWISRYLDDCPDEPYGYYRRGMIYYRSEQYARALTDFQEYVRLAPRALEGYEQLFLCLLELDRLPEAMEAAQRAVAIQPLSFRLQYNLAFAQLLCNQIPEALAGFTNAVGLDPTNEDLLLRIQLALVERVSLGDRLTWFRQTATRYGEQNPLLKGLLAEVCLESGYLEEANRLSQEIIALDPTRPFGYLLGIKTQSLLDRYAEALQLADEGVRVLPDDGRLRIGRALVLRDIGRPEEALRELDLAARMLPHDAEVIRQRALVYGSIGKLPEAVRLLQAAIKLDMENPDTYFWLGYFQLHRRRYQDALTAANRLVHLLPDGGEGHLLRSAALHGLRRHAEANIALARAQHIDPDLLARMSADPVIAHLFGLDGQESLGNRMRHSLAHTWQSFRQALRYGP